MLTVRQVTGHVDSAKRVGERVLRSRGSLSQRQLARSVGVTAAYISRIEHGERLPTLQLLEKIADALGVDLAWLRGQRRTGNRKNRRPISPAAIEADLKEIEAALKRIRASIS